MNNNTLTEAALLGGGKGVFSKTSYITIGSEEKPNPYVSKETLRSSFHGKQFGTAFPKDGKTNDAFFEKKFSWVSENDKYLDKWQYRELQPEDTKKKGFLTSDFCKRDEFTNTIRTGQYRELLKSELKFAKKGIEMFASMGLGDQTQGGAAYEPEPEEERFLYDVVFSKTDPTFKGASKTRRDTLNKTAHNTDRRMGGMSTVNALTFTAAPQYEKPEHGRTRLLQESFYRKTNVVFPGGSAAAMD